MSNQERLSKIRPDLRIQILHKDDFIIVIAKPGGLRSVAGHAQPLATISEGNVLHSRKRPRQEDTQEPSIPAETKSKRQTAQQAWENAIRSFASQPRDLPSIESHKNYGESEISASFQIHPTANEMAQQCLKRLAANANALSSVPRKWKLFQRYILRNRRRLVGDPPAQPTDADDKAIEAMASAIFRQIQQRQKPFLNLPEPTRHEDSAFGQLILMGYDNDNPLSSTNNAPPATPEKKLFVVHRLDCETSGVMVFARTPSAASFLCQAWRERNQVTKTYLARVRHWPPYHVDHLSEGSINIPLAPSEERLKWKVVEENDANARPSTTLWWIQNDENDGNGDGVESPKGVVLRLMPETGRTHQLRIHCAHVGTGIVGDSLYGEDSLDTYLEQTLEQQRDSGRRLCLHAHKLAFLHPITKTLQEFSTASPW